MNTSTHGGHRPARIPRTAPNARIHIATGVERKIGTLWLAVLQQAVLDAKSTGRERAPALRWFHAPGEHCRPGSFAWICDRILNVSPERVLEHLGFTKEQLYPQGQAA